MSICAVCAHMYEHMCVFMVRFEYTFREECWNMQQILMKLVFVFYTGTYPFRVLNLILIKYRQL